MFDTVDEKLIALLQQNSRASYTELAEAVHLSRPSVVERIKKYLEKGLIEKFTAIFSHKKLGRNVTMFIRVTTLKVPLEKMYQVLDRDSILEVYAVTGEEKFIVKAATKDLDEMQDLLNDLLQYADIVTSIIIDKYSVFRPVTPVS